MPVFGNLLLPMLSLVRFARVTDRDSGTLIVIYRDIASHRLSLNQRVGIFNH